MFSFTSFLKTFLVLSSLVCQVASSPLQRRGPTCQNVTIPVTVSATNAIIPNDISFDPETIVGSVLNLLFLLIVPATTFDIAARYCEPEVIVASRSNTLQLLVHGATYTRNYWSGAGEPGLGYDGDKYSWIAYASKEGYPTLSIDRLGSGASSHPDPITVVQDPVHSEITRTLVNSIRAGKAKLPRKFPKVIYVGHSFGSLIGHLMNVKYPNLVDLSILTGFSKQILSAIPGLIANSVLVPAAIALPAQYGPQGLNLPAGYLVFSSQSGTRFIFYGGDFDPAFAEDDFNHRGTMTVGEAATGGIVSVSAGHTKPVLVITGRYDTIFCNPTGLQATPADCDGDGGILDQTRSLYPNAGANYYWQQLENAGHCWQFHNNAAVGFKASHDWMAARGF